MLLYRVIARLYLINLFFPLLLNLISLRTISLLPIAALLRILLPIAALRNLFPYIIPTALLFWIAPELNKSKVCFDLMTPPEPLPPKSIEK